MQRKPGERFTELGVNSVQDFEIVFKRPTYLSVDCHISSTIDGRGTYTEAFLKKYTCKHVHQLPETIDNGKYWRTLRFKNIVGVPSYQSGSRLSRANG